MEANLQIIYYLWKDVEMTKQVNLFRVCWVFLYLLIFLEFFSAIIILNSTSAPLLPLDLC